MTKRFNYEYVDDKFYDKGFFLDNGKRMFKDEVLNTLNELAEENESLKEQREKLFFRERDTKNRWRELKQENEELKKQMERLYNYFVDWHGDIMGANQFSEMWDDVKEDEDWED